MIYCVVPKPLADELYDKLVDYYKDDPNVKVIIDRREGRIAAPGARPPRRAPRRRATAADTARAGHVPDRRNRRARQPSIADERTKVIVHVDGGARGNPGPAAAAAVVSRRRTATCWPSEGKLHRRGHQQRGRVPGRAARRCELARELGAREVEVVNDSELVARQIGGAVQGQARASSRFRGGDGGAARVRRLGGPHVRREHNVRADELVNEALDRALGA